jgi:hypothetical protein
MVLNLIAIIAIVGFIVAMNVSSAKKSASKKK